MDGGAVNFDELNAAKQGVGAMSRSRWSRSGHDWGNFGVRADFALKAEIGGVEEDASMEEVRAIEVEEDANTEEVRVVDGEE